MSELIQVKICGLTNYEDALLAATAGADYLGFIFYPPSSRATTAVAVRPIIQQLRAAGQPAKCVGVFVNEPPEKITAVMNDCGLDLAQLHGEEVPSLINDPASILYGRAFKALRPTSLGEAEAEAEWYSAEAPELRPTLLIDAYHPHMRGGTGDLSDWEIARHLTKHTPALMLAGGLTPQNVAQAIREVRPFGVDVASGVELAGMPGRKDPNKLRDFCTAVKTAL